MICSFCGKECKNSNSHRNHERLCPRNVDREYVSHTLGKTAWNKGLSCKDPRVELYVSKNRGRRFISRKSVSVESKKKMSESRKKMLLEHPENHPNRLLAGNRNKMTYPELVAFDCLTTLGVKFEHQKKIDRYFVDFLIDKTIIEIDGERWHSSRDQIQADQQRDSKLRELGFNVIRIKSKERIEDIIKLRLAQSG